MVHHSPSVSRLTVLPRPFESRTPSPGPRTFNVAHSSSVSPALRWAVRPGAYQLVPFLLATPHFPPASAFNLLLLPVVLYINWELLSPYLAPDIPNPFATCFFLSGHIPTSAPHDPRYAKSYHDLIFIAYNIVFFSFVRQLITVNLCRPVAKYFRLKREAKIDRFGEQGYALVYFMIFGAWGFVSPPHLTPLTLHSNLH